MTTDKEATSKSQVKVIKKGPPADTLASALFGMMEIEMKDEHKGNFDCHL